MHRHSATRAPQRRRFSAPLTRRARVFCSACGTAGIDALSVRLVRSSRPRPRFALLMARALAPPSGALDWTVNSELTHHASERRRKRVFPRRRVRTITRTLVRLARGTQHRVAPWSGPLVSADLCAHCTTRAVACPCNELHRCVSALAHTSAAHTRCAHASRTHVPRFRSRASSPQR